MIFKTFWKPVCWALIIIILSVIPTDDLDSQMWSFVPYEDKIMHFIFYGIFSFLLMRAFLKYYKKTRPALILAFFTFVFIFIFGVILEIIQASLTSYREGDIMDMIFNLAGCISAILLILLIPFFRSGTEAKL